MNLSRRERIIGTLTAAVILVLAGDRFLLMPYLELRDSLEARKRAAVAEIQKSADLLRRAQEIEAQWKKELDAGIQMDAGAAESMTLNALRNWAADSGLSLSSVKPEGTSTIGGMQEISFQAIGEGRMRTVTRFLHLIENAEVPIKATDLQVTTRKEGTDDLTLQVRIAALCVAETGVTAETRTNGRNARQEGR